MHAWPLGSLNIHKADTGSGNKRSQGDKKVTNKYLVGWGRVHTVLTRASVALACQARTVKSKPGKLNEFFGCASNHPKSHHHNSSHSWRSSREYE